MFRCASTPMSPAGAAVLDIQKAGLDAAERKGPLRQDGVCRGGKNLAARLAQALFRLGDQDHGRPGFPRGHRPLRHVLNGRKPAVFSRSCQSPCQKAVFQQLYGNIFHAACEYEFHFAYLPSAHHRARGCGPNGLPDASAGVSGRGRTYAAGDGVLLFFEDICFCFVMIAPGPVGTIGTLPDGPVPGPSGRTFAIHDQKG